MTPRGLDPETGERSDATPGRRRRVLTVALRRGYLRPMAHALDAYAAELDAADGKGT